MGMPDQRGLGIEHPAPGVRPAVAKLAIFRRKPILRIEPSNGQESVTRHRDVVARKKQRLPAVRIIVIVEIRDQELADGRPRVVYKLIDDTSADQGAFVGAEMPLQFRQPCAVRTAVVISEREIFAL